jgi:hypothetical protein
MHLVIGLNANSVVLGDVRLEDVAKRADFVGAINVTDVGISEIPSCGIRVIATDIFSREVMYIHVSNLSDVKNIGKHFAFLQNADKSMFHVKNNCLDKSKQSYVASAAYQTIFPFGNGVAFAEDSIIFYRASIFSSSRYIPAEDFIKGFSMLSDDIVGEVDLNAVVQHLCLIDVSNESSTGLRSFCHKRRF